MLFIIELEYHYSGQWYGPQNVKEVRVLGFLAYICAECTGVQLSAAMLEELIGILIIFIQ